MIAAVFAGLILDQLELGVPDTAYSDLRADRHG